MLRDLKAPRSRKDARVEKRLTRKAWQRLHTSITSVLARQFDDLFYIVFAKICVTLVSKLKTPCQKFHRCQTKSSCQILKQGFVQIMRKVLY